MSRVAANKVYKNLKFTNWVRVLAVSYSGYIWILWNEEVKATNPQFIVLDVESEKGGWNLVVVYANSSSQL